jgi:DDE superfamily endonuclease
MFATPSAAEPLVQSIRHVFTRRTFERFVTLMCGVIVTMGRRTVSRALRAMEPHLRGHWSNYHRIYSQAQFSMWKLGLALLRQVVALLPADEPIILIVDDTVHQKKGPKVWAKGAHRDARRSSRSHTGIKFGHKWLVMCVLARLPGMNRPWALPVLCGLCRPPKTAGQIGQRCKTPSRLSLQLLMRMMRWFPQRRFILLGDSRAVSHAVACFVRRHADRVTLISRLRADANLYDTPRNRGAKKGRKKPSPQKQAEELPPITETVQWYGSSRRKLRHVSDTALWYSNVNNAVVPVRWVCVLADPKLNMEQAYFYSTDPTLPARRIVELYALRWNIEVTFEESRALLGLETTRHRCKRSVLRVTPILLGLFTAVALIWKELSRRATYARPQRFSQTPCYRKATMTFADALFWVRRELWMTSLLQHHDSRRCSSFPLKSLPRSVRGTILWHLAAAA